MRYQRRSPVKMIADPISGIVDVGPVLSMIETREFQALADKRQLGMTYLVFRAGLHTRFNHCVGAYHATRELATRWIKDGAITKEESDALAAYALLHDVGHPAFSHTTEDFCNLPHDKMTLELIQNNLRGAIEACGVNSTLVAAFAKHEHPLYRAVHDKNLGMEKLDYLDRDGFYTLLSRLPGTDYLRKYIYYVEDQVVIDEKVVGHARDVLDFYIKMYKEVYFRKALVIAQRMFHKAVYHLIRAKELSAVSLPHMTDSELLACMIASDDDVVQYLYRRLRERALFKEAVVMRSERFAGETRVGGKRIAVFGLRHERMEQLVQSPVLQKKNHAQLEEIEEKIGRIAHIPPRDVLVVPVFGPERFEVKDIMIYGSDGNLHSLRARYEETWKGMEEQGRSYAALRVCVSEEHREKVSSLPVANTVCDFILSR